MNKKPSKIPAITVRVVAIIIFAVLAMRQMSRIGIVADNTSKLYMLSIAIPVLIIWGLFNNLRELINDPNPFVSAVDIDQQKKAERERQKEKRENPDGQYISGILQAADLLSDYSTAVKSELEEWLSRKKEGYSQENTIYEVFIEALVKYGFVGVNDWKFELADYLFNSEPTFKHYNIDMSVYEDIVKDSQIYMPEAIQVIKQHLPEEYGAANLDLDSDEYLICIAPQERLEKAKEILNRLGEKLYLVELGLMAEI